MKPVFIYILLILLSICTGGFIEKSLHSEPSIIREETRYIEIRDKPYYQREEINQIIRDKIDQGAIDRIVSIYAEVCGDPGLAHMITSFSIIYDIPVSLLFAIISVESSFDPNAINRNANGTLDFGLMALNSKTFKRYTREQLYDVRTNLRLGCEHLVWLKKKYGSWGIVVIRYNGRYEKGADEYLVKVFEKERDYEKLFNKEL